MLTHLESKTPFTSDLKPQSQSLSLARLIEQLESQRTAPSLEQLQAWLENSEISAADLEPYVGFKEGNYWRHRICRNEFVEMLALCWRPGHRTPIHDHNGSHGAVLVYQGILWETTFDYEAGNGLVYKSGHECHQGEVTGAGVPDIHQLGNPDVSAQNLITIHIYAPPLGVLNTYKAGSPQIDRYTPDDSDS